MNTQELLEQHPALTDDQRTLLLSAIATRGKNKGYVLANPPSKGNDGKRWAAWSALVGSLAPQRLSVWAFIISTHGAKETFDELDLALRKSGLNRLVNITEPEYKWNLYAHHHNIDVERKQLVQLIRILRYRAACKHDGFPEDTKFAVFSNDNPYAE